MGENAQVGIYRGQGGRERFCLPDRPETAFYALGLAASTDMVTAFGCRVLSGSLKEVAAADNQFILTESMARRLFGHVDVVGKGICRMQGNNASYYTVGAVVEDCRGKSNLYYDFIRPLWVGDYERNSVNYCNFHILLRTSNPEQTGRELSRIDPEEKGSTGKLVLTPLRMYHKTGDGSGFVKAYFYQLAFVVVSLLLVLSAVVNLLAVYTSVFLGRIREYALRRSLGASDAQNAGWMLTEVLPVVFLGLLLAAMGEEWLRYEGYVLGDVEQVGRFLAAVSGFSRIALSRRDGIPCMENEGFLPSVFLRPIPGAADARLDARGAVFRECVAAFPFVGDATPDFRDGPFRLGLRAQ